MKKLRKFAAILLVCALLIQVVPLAAMAQDSETPSAYETGDIYQGDPPPSKSEYLQYEQPKTPDFPAEEDGETPIVVEEVIEKRGEDIKHFRLSDGSMVAAVYGMPVHYMEDGEWVDYDNSLEVTTDNGGAQVFTNQESSSEVSLPETLDEGEKLSLTNEEYTIEMEVAVKEPSEGVIEEQAPLTAETAPARMAATANQEQNKWEKMDPNHLMVLENVTSAVKYEDVYPNTDIEYIVSPLGIKENVIVHEPQLAYRYTFNLNIPGLTAKLKDDNSIDFIDPEKPEEPVYFMPTPIMDDAGGADSTAIKVELSQEGDTCTLVLTADAQWINSLERKFPVTIDPSLKMPTSPPTIHETYASTDDPDHEFYRGEKLAVGYNRYGRNRTYVRFDLPALSNCGVIVDAAFQLTQKDYDPGTGNTANMFTYAYDTGSTTWTEDQITWNNQPVSNVPNGYKTGRTAVDYYPYMGHDGSYYRNYIWGITSIVKNWYENGNNTGLVIVSSDETVSKNADFFSSDYGLGADSYPAVYIAYLNNDGLEDKWTYHSVSNGRAGTASVNDYSGNLVYTHEDYAIGGNRMPIGISHVYNMNQDHSMGRYMNMKLGQGFRLSVWTSIQKEGDKYKLIDSDATVHYFKKDTTDSTGKKYLNETDSSQVLTVNSADATLTDPLENKITFTKSSDGQYFYVKSIANKYGDKQNYTYSNNQLVSITDPASRVVYLDYDGNGYLSAIRDANNTIRFAYSGDFLTSITYPDNQVTTLRYSSSYYNRLYEIVAPDGKKIAAGIKVTLVKGGISCRVSSLQLLGTNGTQSNKYTFTYRPGETEVKDVNGKSETMMFDDAGRTVSVRDQEGRAAYQQFNNGGNQEDTLKYQSNMRSSIVNLLRNTGAEYTKDVTDEEPPWQESRYNYPAGAGTTSMTSAEKYKGKYCFKVYSGTNTGVIEYLQNIPTYKDENGNFEALPLKKNTTYTLSAYVKIPSGLNKNGTNAGARIQVQIGQDGAPFVSKKSEFLSLPTNGWQRLSVTLNSGNTTWALATMGVENATGTVFFDNVQLEEGAGASDYNYLENAEMKYSHARNATHVPDMWTEYQLGSGDWTWRNYGMHITGTEITDKSFGQRVMVNGKKGDSLVYGGWIQSNSVYMGNYLNLRTRSPRAWCAYELVVEYTNGTTKYYHVEAEAKTSGLQYVCGAETAEYDYTYVMVRGIYYRQLNGVDFLKPELHVGGFANHYTYDDRGRVTASMDDYGAKTNYTYTGEDLTQMESIAADGTVTKKTMTYNDKHDVTKEVYNDGTYTEYTYGEKGLVTKEVTYDAARSAHTAKEYVYSSNWNFLNQEINEFGETTTYDYSWTKGTLNSVTDPKGVKTGYTYDWKGTLLTTSVSATINGVTQKLSNTYAYDQDKLSSVSHNGINYSFAYDEFGRNTQNKVGNQILITNEYDAQNRLKKSTYGNGHTVEPVYDSLDRVTSKKYNGLTEFSWQYARDNKVTQYTNEITGITENYVYNERGQLSKIADSNRNLLLYSYNEKRQLSALQATYNDETKTASYAYDALNRMTSLNIATSPSVTWSYDSLSRMNKEEISHNGTANSLWKTEYSYLPGTLSTEAGSTSGRIGQVSLSKNRDGEVKYSRNIGYTYDANGNIATILENGVVKATYTYDELNQLVREDNGYLNKSITYTYDKGGNLLNKKEYAYTTGTLGATSNIITYSYGDANWPDKMTEFNGQAVTYDAIGNPLSYAGNTYTWEHGRQLKSLSGNGKNSSYQYDADGMRKKKTVDGVTTTYYYQGGALLYQNNGTDAIWFFYGNGGKLSAMRINGGVYYYYYNAQGDVLGLINTSGDIYCQYTYDSWGKLVSIKDASGNDKTNDLSFYGTKNPFRYRGYYYDTETGMYYLQSRYYMPEWGRFLNADGLLNPSTTGKNLFGYCNNNPVNMADPDGHKAIYITQSEFNRYYAQYYNPSTNKFSFTHYDDYYIPYTYNGLTYYTEVKANAKAGETSTKPRNVEPEIAPTLSLYVKQAQGIRKLADATSLLEPYRYGTFALLVNHGGAWDIKRQDSWESTIGTPFPGYGVQVEFIGIMMTPEQIGNFTFGFLGAAYGIPLDALLTGSVFAAYSGGSMRNNRGFYNEFGDWGYISSGYNYYYGY